MTDAEFLVCFDTSTLVNSTTSPYKRMPYPIPVIENPTSTAPVVGPHEQATVTGLFPDGVLSDWTVAVHVAFPDNWDSFWAARSGETSWPLFTLHQSPAYADSTIEVRMYAGASAGDAQTIKATVRIAGVSGTTTIALPTVPGFFAHSGSPIWIAISLQDGETLTLAARAGAGRIETRPETNANFEALTPNVCAFAGWDTSIWTPRDVTPLLIFSLFADNDGRNSDDLVDFLNSPILITGVPA